MSASSKIVFKLRVRRHLKSGLLGKAVIRRLEAKTFREADTRFKRANPDYFIEDISPRPSKGYLLGGK